MKKCCLRQENYLAYKEISIPTSSSSILINLYEHIKLNDIIPYSKNNDICIIWVGKRFFKINIHIFNLFFIDIIEERKIKLEKLGTLK